MRIISTLCGKWGDHDWCSGWTSGISGNVLRKCQCACHAKASR